MARSLETNRMRVLQNRR